MSKLWILSKPWILFAAALVFAFPAIGKEYENKEAQLEVDIPDNWKVELGDVLTAESPDEEANILMTTIHGVKNMEAALDHLDEELSKIITDITTEGEGEIEKINGLSCDMVHGTGKVDGETLHWAGAVVQNGEHFCIILAFGTEKGLEKHGETTTKIFRSLRSTAKKEKEKKKAA